ncbi:MAG: NusG domain II-containing protein [Eubacterium sp.]|nr:NusG domain II-containing protein [Eubacterium sp.]MBR4241088.1 NusG domain II-containing protein [Eubacterium sp.]
MKKIGVKKGDIIVLAALLCIAALIFCALHFLVPGGDNVRIEVASKTVATLPLDEDTIYNVEIDSTITNTVEIKNKKVSVISADCPDKICVNHRAISKSGESIICLPNKVVVSIEGEKTEVDGEAR